jgi:hypothetical protein
MIMDSSEIALKTIEIALQSKKADLWSDAIKIASCAESELTLVIK